jgi:succinyl-CoA synthetase alpha subunit
MIKANAYVKERNARLMVQTVQVLLLQVKQSWYHARFCLKGTVGIVSKSGTLTYKQLTKL